MLAMDTSEDENGCLCYSCCVCCGCKYVKRESKGVWCCACIPIKVGITIIAMSVFFLTFFYTFTIFMLWANRYVNFWYPLILLVTLAPIYYASFAFWYYMNMKKNENRAKLFWAVLLTILTVVLYTIWEVCYILFFYEHDYFYRGYGDPEKLESIYAKETKEFTVVIELCTSAIVIVYLSYCAWTCFTWMNLGDE